MTVELRPWEPHWKRRYNSLPDNLINDFDMPAFSRACSYGRAVDFFSSSFLARVAPAIDGFVANGGNNAVNHLTSKAQ